MERSWRLALSVRGVPVEAVKVALVASGDPRVLEMLRTGKATGTEWSHLSPRKEALCTAGSRAGWVGLPESFGMKNSLGASDTGH